MTVLADDVIGAPVRSEVFGPSHRTTTIGVLLLISMVAFEAMGVGTAMPALVADLGAVSLYAWPFVAFMAAGVFGTVLGGRWCDLAGPRIPLVVAPTLFGAGLLVAGTAAGMPQLLVGRVLQGLGAGILTVAVYVLIAHAYSERTRPAMFGLMSSAWVLPSLIGPPVAGVVTERFSWHWVFLGLVPVVLLAIGLIVPAARQLGRPQLGRPQLGRPLLGRPERRPVPRRRGLVLAALCAALAVAALSWASQHPGATAAVVAGAALVLLVPSMRALLPAGVFRAARGVPTVVVARGLLAGVFFAANSYLPLILTSVHHWSLATAGIPLVVGSLGWSASSAWQGHHPALPRHRLLRIGFSLLTAGVLGLLLVAPSWGTPWLALPLWGVAGIGMGLGYSAVAFLLLQQSGADEVGFNSSAAQMSDQLTTAILIGAGGALLALLGSPAFALPVLLATLAGLGALGVTVAGRAATE